MRCNHNPETGLRNNDGYAEAVVHSAGQSNTVNNAPQLSTILVASAHEQDQILIRTDQLLRWLDSYTNINGSTLAWRTARYGCNETL
ncbi:hypothetical protein HBI56_241950 [Parastagonospora nodorum]|uniref:Uncharacterized protein n=1 Tax=Phaeosphaeria nodorum (strain SN15 / ATCC MYA-4574 / FGSC 10173) TaxID=321614 RepID=Q0UGC6_PHANO|nr:hypothetical protein SNOG_01373 [Parastagonospora nodorum SN15]XP_001799489.1 hypothetical protein SNOG_09188 [Parastagonospora nodorum SN15]XP_001806681.1 hypothetical protein SNOG_16596 [Parastagonospora nodorum SN15]KAH3957864.1 hypothetical protein HBH51_218770 [Parastagonospora nodorum]EAT83380.1 hypothetical protein SNOG_09188 [Parastagonospora nodorum SN15]EAT91022.1 hypothetical protein SNOG_01373 [Parastagonospora nodorum SN15]EAT92619.1 hypothetical protein SNOG_16596 [Parastagon